jgi:hypothetical protein
MILPRLLLALLLGCSFFLASSSSIAQNSNVSARFNPKQNILHLSISKRYLAYADSNVIISQLLTDTVIDSIYFFSEYIQYDKNIVEFIDVVNGSHTLSPDWTITKTATAPGTVKVSAVSSDASLSGPGEILKILFHVLDTTRTFQTADFSDTGAVFGIPLETIVISDTGRLRIIDACTSILLQDGIPATLSMQCAPNPASGRVTVTYELPTNAQHVQLRLYNLTGNLVRTLLDADAIAGRHESLFDVSELPNGSYFYELTDGNALQMRMLSISH